MGSLGAKSSSSNARPDEFNGLLGARSAERSIGDVLNEVQSGNLINPNFGNGLEYSTNCALCTAAFALYAKGYDVEAMPRDTKWRGFDSVFDVDYGNTDNYILRGDNGGYLGQPTPHEIRSNYLYGLDIPRMPKGANAAAKAIEEKVKSWGDGAFGSMSVKHKYGNGSHAINIINDKGVVKLYDAQSNTVRVGFQAIKDYLSTKVANHTSIMRLDNAPVRELDDIHGLDKIVKRRK